jgi:peptidoglycan/LPS O-acetylase OafA/YrhL
MGMLRLLLAVSVVLSHTAPLGRFSLLGGPFAVKVFYIISGFYMALILNEKYTPQIRRPYFTFITNRIFRIYPTYWVILFCTAIASLIIYQTSHGTQYGLLQGYIVFGPKLHPLTMVFFALTQVLLLGQDLTLFMGFGQDGMLILTSHFKEFYPATPLFMLVPQAWTISIEMMFYFIAPLIVRRKTAIIFACWCAALALNIGLQLGGLDYDPWTYRFFPAELLFFFSGVLAYRVGKRYMNLAGSRAYGIGALSLIFVLTVFYPYIPFGFKPQFYLAVFTLSLPFIFYVTKNLKWDRYIGELSYPVYLIHILIIILLNRLGMHLGMPNTWPVIVLSIIFSLVINELVQKPVERWRQRRVR